MWRGSGIGQQDAEVLREVCLRTILSNEAIEKVSNSHGRRYEVTAYGTAVAVEPR